MLGGYLVLIGIITLCIWMLYKKKKYHFLQFFLFFLMIILSTIFIYLDDQNPTFITFNSHNELKRIHHVSANKNTNRVDYQLTRIIQINQHTDRVIFGNPVVNDDKYIYSISNNKVIVTSIDELEIIRQVTIPHTTPLFLYVTEDKIIIIGELDKNTVINIYDKTDFSLFKEIMIDGVLVTSSLVDDELYIITSQIIEKETNDRPSYLENNVIKYIPYDKIYYIKDTFPNNYINIYKTNVNVQNKSNMISYLGLGQVVYQSPNNIYIAEEIFEQETGNSESSIIIRINNYSLQITGLARVKGYVLDKNSLNEYQGKLRLVTTLPNKGTLYIFNEKLKQISKLENFTNGKEIQATLFNGNKAYVDTFSTEDTFFVIDLTNQNQPKVISTNKFPGYNTSLISVNETHLIGFGLVYDGSTEPQGLQISLYDINSPEGIKLIDHKTYLYKDYQSVYSESLYDTKSLLLDKTKNIIGFPVLYWITEDHVSYYRSFYALYHYNNELSFIGNITHDNEGTKKNSANDIKKGIIRDNQIITVSDNLIKINSLTDLSLIKEIKLPK